MALFTPEEWSFAEKASVLVLSNPFRPGWMNQERELLGKAEKGEIEGYSWKPGGNLWGEQAVNRDIALLGDRIADVGEKVRQRLLNGAAASEQELGQYETLSLYRLYRKYGEQLDYLIDAAVQDRKSGKGQGRLPGGAVPELKRVWDDFRREHAELLRLAGRHFELGFAPEHLFACFFLFRRAFYHIFFNIVGTSRPAARLRGAVWESVLTQDLRGWSRHLYQRMRDFPTLITGPSGTGKESVAEAIGRSLYIPFDPGKKAFATDFLTAFHPVNLSALPALLIESELFGHVQGSFTGAIEDRKGRLEECPAHGAVFLDEVGELSAEIQVKLLRVLQSRRFQRVGNNEEMAFAGKIIAATNRDLAAEIRARRFREDFYYRLCADSVTTPSLREQLDDRPEDLSVMVDFICRRIVGPEEAPELTRRVVAWLEGHPRLGQHYPWSGNFRELEQCVRSYVIRKEYHPLDTGADDPRRALAEDVAAVRLTAAELEARYCGLVLALCNGNAAEAGRRLQCDPRTVKAAAAKGRPGS